jgi:hypothetical protein
MDKTSLANLLSQLGIHRPLLYDNYGYYEVGNDPVGYLFAKGESDHQIMLTRNILYDNINTQWDANDATEPGTYISIEADGTIDIAYGAAAANPTMNVILSIDTNGNLLQNSGNYLRTDEIRAVDGDGLKLFNDGGSGIFVKDDNYVGIGTEIPLAQLHVVNVLDAPSVLLLKLEGKRDNPANNDTLFIDYSMNNSNSDSYEYARTTIRAEDITDGEEEGSLLFEVSRSGSLETVLKMSATEVVVNEPGADRDFRIEAIGVPNSLFVQGSDGYLGFGTGTPAARLEIDGSVTEGQHLLELDQDDNDEPFIKFDGTSAADQTKNISTVNGDGAVEGPKNFSASAGWAFEGMIRIDVNGTDYWIPYYSADTS